MKLSLNVGSTDRWLRVIAGCVLIWMPFAGVVTGGLGMTAYVIGGIALVTGFFRFCPAYTLLGVNTSKTGE